MLPPSLECLSSLKVGTADTRLEVIAGPYVRYSDWGYVPVLHVRVEKSGLDYLLPISARSLAKQLQGLFNAHQSFVGLRFDLRKTGEEKTSSYELKSIKISI
jgi:hypothetical protein